MARLTAEERYERALAQAWRKFGAQRLRPPVELRSFLERANDRIVAGLLSASDSEGNLRTEQMDEIRSLLQEAMSEFRGDYQMWLYGLIYATAGDALNAQNEAMGQYLDMPPVALSAQVPPTMAIDVTEAIKRRVMGGLKLSDRIWRLDWGTRSLLERDIINGISEGMRASALARRVTKYLLPGRELPKGVPSSAYSNQPRDVSYNAYRLARTEINQTWHEVRRQSDTDLAKRGITIGTRWVLSPNHTERMLSSTKGRRDRDICDDWAARRPGDAALKGQPQASTGAESRMLRLLEHYDMDPKGVFLPGKAPIDHPNGLCTTASVLTPREVIMQRMAA